SLALAARLQRYFRLVLIMIDPIAKSPSIDFLLNGKRKCDFHFPYKPMTCCASHRFARPSMAAMTTSCEAVNDDP
ncbi:MAG: hypothetical protein R8J85_10670, partial [Mariprofundales bacterium]